MDTGAGPNTSEGPRPADDSAPLAQIEASESINFKNGKATIRTLVSVKKCPHGFRSRLGYHANLYITLPDGVERDIGYITAWRISRPSGVNPNIDPQYCMAEWYFESLRRYDEDSKQLAYCIRSLYGKGEIPRRISDRVVNAEKRNELQDGGNELMFIETIYIKWREDRNDARTEVRNNEPARFNYFNTDMHHCSIEDTASPQYTWRPTTGYWVAGYYLLGSRYVDQ